MPMTLLVAMPLTMVIIMSLRIWEAEQMRIGAPLERPPKLLLEPPFNVIVVALLLPQVVVLH